MCETVHERQCHAHVKQVPDKKCHSTYDEVCTRHPKTVYDHSYSTQCKPVQTEVETKLEYLCEGSCCDSLYLGLR